MKNLKFKSMVSIVSFLLLAVASLSLPVNARTAISPNAVEAMRGRERSIVVMPENRFRIDVWTNQPDYYIGDDIRIYFQANFDSYVYIFDIDTNGVTRQIFPNYYDRDNYVRGGNVYSIPDYGYRLEVTGPPGREYLRAVAVRDRYPFLRDFERFEPSDPFPRPRGGFDGFKLQLESRIAEKQFNENGEKGRFDEYPSGDSREMERERDLRELKPGAPQAIDVVPRPVRPLPPYRTYAESYTSFYVRARWYERDDAVRRPVRRKRIEFNSIPDGVELYIDGKLIGITPQKVYLDYGSHLIRMRKRGYSDWVRYLFVNDKSPSKVFGDLTKRSNEHYQPYRPEWDRYFRDDRKDRDRR